MSKVKFSVLGFGRIGQRHAKIINEYSESELISIIDVDESKFESSSSLELNTEMYTNIEQFLEQDESRTEIVCIASPNGFHTDYAVQLMRAGYSVVIEKPMGLTTESCEKVLSTMIETGKQAFVVKQNRYSPPSKWLKSIVDQKTIGDVLMVQTNCYWNRDERYYSASPWRGTRDLDGGALFTQFSHFIDLLYWVFGDIKNVTATIKNFTHPNLNDFDDSGFAQFEFLNGGIGSLNYSTSCWNQNMESSITVIGSKGSIKIGGQYMNKIEYCHVENYDMPELEETNPPNDYGPYKGSAANHHFVIENVVNALQGNKSETTNVFEGMKVVSFIEKIYRASGFIK
ncbi:MAG: Gfo/Idh/MocA family oxidoreductase [Balneola sp.]